MADLPRWRESDRYSALERLALDLAERMTATPAEVPDSLREALLDHLSPGQLMELTSAIAWENHRARVNRALGVQPMGFSDGAFCLLPHQPATPDV